MGFESSAIRHFQTELHYNVSMKDYKVSGFVKRIFNGEFEWDTFTKRVKAKDEKQAAAHAPVGASGVKVEQI